MKSHEQLNKRVRNQGTRILIHQRSFSNPGNENEGKRVNSNCYDLNGKNGIAEKGGKKERTRYRREQ